MFYFCHFCDQIGRIDKFLWSIAAGDDRFHLFPAIVQCLQYFSGCQQSEIESDVQLRTVDFFAQEGLLPEPMKYFLFLRTESITHSI